MGDLREGLELTELVQTIREEDFAGSKITTTVVTYRKPRATGRAPKSTDEVVREWAAKGHTIR